MKENTIMKKYLTGGIALLSLGLVLPAQAQKPDGDRPGRNGERKARFQEMAAKRFQETDKDNSNGISLKEMQDAVLDRVQKRFTEMDDNKDGEISKDEFKAHPPRRGPRPRGKGGRDEDGVDAPDDDADI